MAVVGALDAYAAAFLAVLLLVSAAHKALDRRRMVDSVQELAGLEGGPAILALTGAAVAECAAGIALILPATRLFGAVAAAVIWSVYLRLILRAVAEGRADIDCGCTFGRRPAPLGMFDAARNLTLVALAAATAAGAARAPMVGAMEIVAGLGLLTLYMAIEQILGAGAVVMISYLIASQVVLWIAVIVLGAVCIALARQVGLLHERIAPAGALMLPGRTLTVGEAAPALTLTTLGGESLEIGGARGGRSQLLFFLAPDCPVCKTLLPVLKSSAAAERDWLDVVLASDGDAGEHAAFAHANGLEGFPYVLSEALGRAFGVSKLPHAALIDETGKLAAMGLINTREHLESLFEAKERGVTSLQQFLRRREPATSA